jgi:hypothetical protein
MLIVKRLYFWNDLSCASNVEICQAPLLLSSSQHRIPQSFWNVQLEGRCGCTAPWLVWNQFVVDAARARRVTGRMVLAVPASCQCLQSSLWATWSGSSHGAPRSFQVTTFVEGGEEVLWSPAVDALFWDSQEVWHCVVSLSALNRDSAGNQGSTPAQYIERPQTYGAIAI